MTQISVDKDFLEELADTKLRVLQEEIEEILVKWAYDDIDQLLSDAKTGILEEAEDDAVCLRNLVAKRDNLVQFKTAIDKDNSEGEGGRPEYPQGDQWTALILAAKEELLSLRDDWDGEGAQQVKESTFWRAVRFLRSLQAFVQQQQSAPLLELPDIFPRPNGDILIQWKTDQFQLVVTIPEDESKPAVYYGKGDAENVTKGTVTFAKLPQIYVNCVQMFS